MSNGIKLQYSSAFIQELLQALGYEVKPSTNASSNDNKENSSGNANREQGGGGNAKGTRDVTTVDKVKRERLGETPTVSANNATGGGGGDGGGKQLVPGIKLSQQNIKSESVAEEEPTAKTSDGPRPKDQLMYLSKIIGFKVRTIETKIET